MVYMDTNKSNTHADPLLGSRCAQMWVHMWAQTLVIFLVYVTKGNTDCATCMHFSLVQQINQVRAIVIVIKINMMTLVLQL